MINKLFNSSILFEGAEGVEPEVEEIEELKEVEETLDEYPEADDSSIDEIETEATRDFAMLEAASYIIDVVTVETALIKGESEAGLLMENAIVDTFKKLKDFLIKIAKKIKAFFLKLIENIKIFFMKGTDFVKKYKTQLTSKSVKGFSKKYHEMKYAQLNAVDGFANGFKSNFDRNLDMVDNDKISDKMRDGKAEEEELSDEEFEKSIKNVTGGKITEVSGIKEYLREQCGMDGAASEIDEFKSGPAVAAMIKFVEESTKIIKDAQEAEKESEKQYSALISKLDKCAKDYASKNEDAEKNGNVASWVRRYANKTRKYASFVLACRKAKIDVAIEMQRESVSVLKSFMYHNPKVEKNSADFGYESNGNMFDTFSI
jgi:hypothetical protein